MGEVCLNVEKFFGKPMDIEWGLADGRFSLLQSRPVRGLEIFEDVEVGRKAEIDRLRSLVNGSRKVWVMHNLAETLPAPTPLTWDIIKRFMSGDGGFGRMYRDFGYRPSPQVCREGFLDLIGGRIYADPDRAADLFWSGMPMSYDRDALAKDPRLLDAAPTTFDPDKASLGLAVRLPGLLWRMLRCSRSMKRTRKLAVDRFEKTILPPYRQWVKTKRAEDLKPLSTAAVLSELDARTKYVLDDFGGESLKPGFFAGLAQSNLEQLLVQILGQQAGTQLALGLTQGLDGDTTVQQNECLYRVARGQESLDQFIELYGHRTVEEMELSRPRWREDPSYLKQVLSTYADEKMRSPHEMHEQNARNRREAEQKLPETLRKWGAASLLEDIIFELRDAQAMLPYREAGKHYLMMGYETIRLAIMELSRRWDLGRDIFFLTRDELQQFESRKTELAPIIAKRKLRWQSSRRLEMAEVIDSAKLEELGLPRKYEAAQELTGQSIASGVASGAARIVSDPANCGDLGVNYVLVCHSTDPGWTALFAHARALIVEQGGVLSHGAIVAHDFGIPAVVCPDVTKRIPEGTTVRVDGNRGLITLLNGKE